MLPIPHRENKKVIKACLSECLLVYFLVWQLNVGLIWSACEAKYELPGKQHICTHVKKTDLSSMSI